MKAIQLSFISILFLLYSCTEQIEKQDFKSFLNEPCMIVNYEQDNTIEGEYIIVEEINAQDSSININIPEKFFLNNSNLSNWFIGWGNDQPLYDAGVENLRTIASIDISKNTLQLGNLLRGSGFPKKDQRIVFWNKNPSGFVNKNKQPIIDPSDWPEFAGKSISFSSIEFDSILKKWITIVNECDTSKVQIYATMSSDLHNWEPANDGKPILKAEDFKSCKWSNSTITTPVVSDIVRLKNKWFLFLDGFSGDGKRNIGIAISENSILGPYKIIETPIISTGKDGAWDEEACFYAKVKKYKEGFILFYDGKNKEGLERIGMATSTDLISWTESDNNPIIDQHTGWRSAVGTTEPCHIEIKGDSILLMIAGAKEFKMGAWHHYITKRMYMDRSGNVNDTQLGIYLSTDGGKTFTAHKNNPVFTNDYSNLSENDHLGGNLKLIQTDSLDYLFYQGKSDFNGLKYNIMLRTR